jgi:hypothetical protein
MKGKPVAWAACVSLGLNLFFFLFQIPVALAHVSSLFFYSSCRT